MLWLIPELVLVKRIALPSLGSDSSISSFQLLETQGTMVHRYLYFDDDDDVFL
jgi:hypothetical protein